MKTMRVHWAESAVEQAVARLKAVVDAADTERTYRVADQPLSWMDLACLLDLARQCGTDHSAAREQLFELVAAEYDDDSPPTLLDVVDMVRHRLQYRSEDCDRVLDALLPFLRTHPLGRDDVQGDNLRAGYVAKAAAEVLVWQADKLAGDVPLADASLSVALLRAGFRSMQMQVDAMARRIREQDAELAELRAAPPIRQPRVWDLADCETEPDDCTQVTDAAGLLWTRNADGLWKAKDRLPITWWTLVRKRGPLAEVLEVRRG
jgi:hypothetical protein